LRPLAALMTTAERKAALAAQGRHLLHVFFEEHTLTDFDGTIVHRRYDAG
jgi:hypothetical protein